jgi:hypothetical protein
MERHAVVRFFILKGLKARAIDTELTMTFEMNGRSAWPINRDDRSKPRRFCKIIHQ